MTIQNLSKEDDVRKYVIRREIPAKGDKKAYTKAPKIQRLITPLRLQRKKSMVAQKKRQMEASRDAAQEYHKLLAVRAHEQQVKRHEVLKNRRRNSSHKSQSSEQ